MSVLALGMCTVPPAIWRIKQTGTAKQIGKLSYWITTLPTPHFPGALVSLPGRRPIRLFAYNPEAFMPFNGMEMEELHNRIKMAYYVQPVRGIELNYDTKTREFTAQGTCEPIWFNTSHSDNPWCVKWRLP